MKEDTCLGCCEKISLILKMDINKILTDSSAITDFAYRSEKGTSIGFNKIRLKWRVKLLTSGHQ